MPSATSITEVRKFATGACELRAYLMQPEVADMRERLGYGPAPVALRMPTEAEIMQIAEALDAGVLINPRLWNETFAVSDEAQREAA